MTSRPVTCLTALSLFVCLTIGGLWVRSYLRYDQIKYVGSKWVYEFQSNKGLLILGRHSVATDWYHPRGSGWYAVSTRGTHYFNTTRRPQPWCWLGLHLPRFGPERGAWAVAGPQWALCLATALLPTWRLIKRRRQVRRGRLGLCERCGYDLRATHSTCPECGTKPVAAQSRDGPERVN